MAYTNVWTTAAPLDTQAANQGAVDFRATKLDVMQRIASFGAGLLANQPTPETTSANADWTGVTYLATDTNQLFRWNGSSWDNISTSVPLSFTPTFAQAFGAPGSPYSCSSLTYVPVDNTNLTYTVTIPVGWKLAVFVSGTAEISQNGQIFSIAIVDGSTVVSECEIFNATNNAVQPLVPFSLMRIIGGDGASHTITLQFKVNSLSFTQVLVNNPASPQMIFIMSKSN